MIYPNTGLLTVPGTSPLIGIGARLFNLPRFIPLLVERMKISTAPGTYTQLKIKGRIFLVNWIFLLNTVPDLEVISHLPDFLDGYFDFVSKNRLFTYLSDPNVDVRTATLNLLTEFLKEMNVIVRLVFS